MGAEKNFPEQILNIRCTHYAENATINLGPGDRKTGRADTGDISARI